MKVKVLVAQSCLALCKSMDCSLPGSSVQGIYQARKNTGVDCYSFQASLVAQLVKNPSAMREPGFDPWRREWLPTPVFWAGESHGLSMGLQRVGHD